MSSVRNMTMNTISTQKYCNESSSSDDDEYYDDFQKYKRKLLIHDVTAPNVKCKH